MDPNGDEMAKVSPAIIERKRRWSGVRIKNVPGHYDHESFLMCAPYAAPNKRHPLQP